MTQEEIHEHVGRFEREVASVHQALVEAIQREIGDPLQEAAAEAVRQHARLMELVSQPTGDSEEPDEAELDGLLRRVVEYRAAVVEEVLAPLHSCTEALDLGRRFSDLATEAQRGLVQATASTPDLLTREEPPDTYDRRAGDGVLRRGGKVLVRVGRSLGGGFRAVRNVGRRLRRADRLPPPTRVQSVPLRALLHRHATVRLVVAEDEVLESLRQHLALALSHYERELGVWTDAIFESETGGEAEPLDQSTLARRTAMASAAADLATAIEGLAVGDLTRVIEEALAGAVDARRASLTGDLSEVGTFMLDETDLAASDRPARAVREAADRESRWMEWHRQVVARIGLEFHLGRLRAHVLRILEGFEGDMMTTVVDPVGAMLEDACRSVTSEREGVEAAMQRARSSGVGPELDAHLADSRDTLVGALEVKVVEPMDAGPLGDLLRERPDAWVAEIVTLLESLPEVLHVHRPVPPAAPLDTRAKPVEIRLRQIAEQAYDAVLLERLRAAPDPLAAVLDRVRSEVVQLESVIRFNMDSALEELRGGTPESEAHLDGARELALNGLDRTLGSIEELRRALAGAQFPFRERLFEADKRGWKQFHDRVRVEDRMQEQILDVGYRVRSGVRTRAAEASAAVRRGARWIMESMRRVHVRALRLVRLGQSALEGERVTEEQKRRTIDALSTVEVVLNDLPLVYRRLFSFQPVSDPGMLEGRASDMEEVSQHFAQWRRGLTDALVITGYDGDGRTSFLNVVATTVLREADVRRVRLTERILEEEVLASRLADALGVADTGTWTLDRLAAALMSRPRTDDRPLSCIVENIEHLFLRSSADNGLVGAFLAFMSRVDASVFWIATLAEVTWSYLEKVEAATACLVRHHALTPLGRDALEAIVMNRHRRSGLRLEFQPPTTQPPFLRRRLAGARTDEQRQSILRNDYFEQLARLTGQNLLLALFYWVRSVHVDAETSTVRVRALEPISFAFIDTFTLAQSFTLKAFMDHATLTLAEHDRIFRVSHAESHHLFESLGNLLVIEPAGSTERVSQFVFTTIDDRQRYRIRPLVLHPVVVHLRSKNIVA